MTLQQPHTPCSQPTCVPWRWRSSRTQSSRLRRDSTVAVIGVPLTVRVMTRRVATGAVYSRIRMPPAESGPKLRYIGQPVPVIEDRRFVRGRGRYINDLELSGMLHVAVVP